MQIYGTKSMEYQFFVSMNSYGHEIFRWVNIQNEDFDYHETKELLIRIYLKCLSIFKFFISGKNDGDNSKWSCQWPINRMFVFLSGSSVWRGALCGVAPDSHTKRAPVRTAKKTHIILNWTSTTSFTIISIILQWIGQFKSI